ncbi:MAG: DEAD/DEAH box helicase [Spirochaetales bacterium]|nr:DEAD/DEAH box helicase [Spirochaetales bacterium]
MNEFANFHINEKLIEKLSSRGITSATLIQKEVIPKILKGKDVIGQSKTGTGKTLAYLLPLLHLSECKGTSLIIAPTKELAAQIYGEALFYGEEILADKPILLTQLRNNIDFSKKSNFIIGVPGSILKASETGKIKLSSVRRIVLDEADFLIDLGFMDDLHKLFELTVNRENVFIFSATLSAKTKNVIDLASRQKDASRVDPKNSLPETISNQFLPIINDSFRDESLLHILSCINPYLGIIFTRTREESNHVYQFLKEKGFDLLLLNGSLQPSQRKKTITEFKKGKVQYLVATDLASRGIDIESVTHIVNYTLAHNELDYIHRAGRTGRMGESGTVISICNELDEGYLKKYCHNIEAALIAVKIEDNLLVEDKKYKGTKPRFNLKELKSMEKIALAKKTVGEKTSNKKKIIDKKNNFNKIKKSVNSKHFSSKKMIKK